jgi:large subunit ribosomal protein L21
VQAIVEFQGRQYRIQSGELVSVPHLDAEPGTEIVIDRVLLISDGDQVQLGHPTIDGAKVEAKVVRHLRGPKVIVGKYKRRKDYRRRKGYRDDFTEVEIGAIHSK